MPEDVLHLRAQAERCERISLGLTDASSVSKLLKLAAESRREAQKLLQSQHVQVNI